MNRDLVIGIDCSTTAAKAVVWDRHGRAVAEGRVPISRTAPHPGWGEQDPIDWWRAVVTATETASRQVDAKRIASLCVTHQRETFVCLDADGAAIRPAMLWLDTRATDEVAAHGSARVHEVTGKPPNATTSWFKLLWLRRHETRVLERTRWVAEVHAYLVHRMTGLWRTSHGSVDPLGVLDMRSFTLDVDLLAQVGLQPDQIPEIHAPGTVLGGLLDEVAERMGLTPGLPVVAGLGDGQAAGLGAGITGPGAAFLNFGTGMVSGTFSAEYRWGNEFRTMSGALPGTYMPETFIGGGTLNVAWFVERLSDIPARPFGLDVSPEQVLEAAAARIAVGSDGLLALPYLTGALSPYWDGNARGLFFGLSAQHGKAHLYRAMLEGLAMEQRLSTGGVERALGASIECFRAMGGGSRSPLWCQIMADVLRRPVEVSHETETTCLGAGMLAAVGAGLHANLFEAASSMSGVGQTFRPHEPTCAAYDPFYEIYLQLYPRLRDSFAQLQAVLKQAGPPA